jgi:hypothetical protein
MKVFSKRFFFEKKNQKTFVNLGHEWFYRHGLVPGGMGVDLSASLLRCARNDGVDRAKPMTAGLNLAKFFLLLFCSQKRSAFS